MTDMKVFGLENWVAVAGDSLEEDDRVFLLNSVDLD